MSLYYTDTMRYQKTATEISDLELI